MASGHFGNALNQADIESAADVVFSSYGRETALNVNASTNGAVNGDLLVYGDENGIRFGDALRVSGDAIVNASAVHGVSIEADGVVGIIAALYDHSISATDLSGISFTGALSGTEVSLYTDRGNIDVGKITSTSGHSDIYRLNTATIGFVNVNGIESNYTVAIYNGAGDVNLTAPVFGGNTVYSFTGNGVTHGSEYLLSAINKAAVIEGADKFSAHIDLSDLTLLSAGGLNSYALPHLVFDDRALEFADTDRITPFVYPIIETMSPTSEYFFLHLRSDAAAAKSDDEQEDDRVIEEGLPAKAKGVIRDLRPASEEINPAMLLSLK